MTKKSERIFSILSLAISAVPIVWAFVVFYANQNVLASNVQSLENEREYIREKLDQISSKLATIDGRINEHFTKEFSNKCYKSDSD